MKDRTYSLGLLAIFIFIGLIGIVSAAFSVGNASYSIDKTYGGSDAVRGWINVSFDKESATSVFQDSAGKSISLVDLLKKKESYNYLCSPVDCSSDYGAASAFTTKIFTIENTSKIFGLQLSGNVNKVNSVSFTVSSSAGESCENQISIDIGADGTKDAINKNTSSVGCSSFKSYGCYSSNSSQEEYLITTTPYCQKVNLSSSPGFTLGAWVHRIDGYKTVKASLYTLGGQEVANCVLPVGVSVEEISCNVAYTLTEPREHYVCIYSTDGTGTYKIRGNPTPTNGCGFPGLPPPTSSTPGAYQIFAEGKGFGAVGTMQVANTLQSGGNFATVVTDYINKKYGNMDCTQGCVVPIKFSGMGQQLQVYNVSVNYQKSTGTVIENSLYELNETSAKISSGFQQIYLEPANFTVPEKTGGYDFLLKFNGNQLISQKINVSDMPKIITLNPKSTASAYPTMFKVLVNSSSPVTQYTWNFGDGGVTSNTLTEEVGHTYSAIGSYQVTVTATDSKQLSASKTFTVNVSSPVDLINSTIAKIKSNSDRVKQQIATFDTFSQQGIEKTLQLESTLENTTNLERRFNLAKTEEEYNNIVGDLITIKIPPKTVSQGVSATIPFFIERSNVNLEMIKQAGGGDYDANRQTEYEDGIISWTQESMNPLMTYKEFLGSYDGNTEPLVKVFEISLNKKRDISGNYFLIIPKIQGLGFAHGIKAIDSGSYVYVELSQLDRVQFYTTDENVDFTNVPAFISPGFNRLTLTEVSILGEAKPKWAIFILAMLFLFIAAFVAYIILQEWYRRKYENYLFKNRNDLYNMVNYVHNSKKKGMENKEIAENLKKANWSGEQIKYVMKKYAGERTGMLEIPFFNLFAKKKTGPDSK